MNSDTITYSAFHVTAQSTDESLLEDENFDSESEALEYFESLKTRRIPHGTWVAIPHEIWMTGYTGGKWVLLRRTRNDGQGTWHEIDRNEN